MTLVILAAGMGSRYEGLKQIDPVGENGEFIIDFSLYDAVRAGFDKVVFVIKKENFEEFKNTIGKRFENKIKVEYAFQELHDIPPEFNVPSERTKPWGTAHAMLAARELVNEPFAVINADDFYGSSAFLQLSKHLSSANDSSKPLYCMIGYELWHTLTENGSVSRGVCTVSNSGMLVNIVERTKISKNGKVPYYELEGKEYELSPNTVVSMNCWGFTPDIFDYVSENFKRFLNSHIDDIRSEYYLPFAVEKMIYEGRCNVKVYNTKDQWYGVTYKEDREYVKEGIRKLIARGNYSAMNS